MPRHSAAKAQCLYFNTAGFLAVTYPIDTPSVKFKFKLSNLSTSTGVGFLLPPRVRRKGRKPRVRYFDNYGKKIQNGKEEEVNAGKDFHTEIKSCVCTYSSTSVRLHCWPSSYVVYNISSSCLLCLMAVVDDLVVLLFGGGGGYPLPPTSMAWIIPSFD